MSPQRDELESLSRAFAARSQSLAQHQCPEPEQLFEAVSGNLDREQRMQIIDHLSECAECSEAWRIAMEIGVRPDEGAAQSSTSQPSRMPGDSSRDSRSAWKFAIAASVIIGVGLVTSITLREDDGTPQYRDVTDSTAPVSLVSDRLPRDRFLLRWSPGPPGSTYAVRLSTENLSLLFAQQDLDRSALLVPSAVLERARSGEQLLWQVEVRLPDGRRISSETYVVTLQ